MKDVKLISNQILDLTEEAISYQRQKESFLASFDTLFKNYQAGKLKYFEYEKEQKKLLGDKSKEGRLNEYNAYIFGLLKKIETLNQQLFYSAYNDTAYKNIAPDMHAHFKFPEMVKVEVKPKKELEKEIIREIEKPQIVAKPHPVKDLKLEEVKKPIVKTLDVAKELEKVAAEEKKMQELVKEEKKAVVETKDLLEEKPIEKPVEIKKKTVIEKVLAKAKPKVPPIEAPSPKKAAEAVMEKLKAPKKTWLDKAIDTFKPGPMSKYRAAGKEGISFGKFFSFDIIRIIRERSKPTGAIGKETKVGASMTRLETSRRREAAPDLVRADIEKITATALTEEAKRIRSILERRKALGLYKPTFFGALANIFSKRISLFLLDQFPDAFKSLYRQLRLANVKILSNTYINMMVLGITLNVFLAFIIFPIVFASQGLPGAAVAARTFFMLFIVAGLTAGAFFYYPAMKAKNRRRSINSNMPFAINHMAAVASSGVSPNRMFKLLAESKEYAEISNELDKIVNYMEIFGYDILTAVKSVSDLTPSPQFKEFFDGMISTTQSGGDIKNYLTQKADEAMSNYKLERKKYTETISTYSDVYTGILIAAPLFFVATLALVSMLGGKLGDTDVNTVIVIGTYMVIPFLNILFIGFLEYSQPEV